MKSNNFRKIITFPSQSGFTMIEILLVVSLMGVIALALFHSLSNGLKIWDRSCQFVMEENNDILFERLAQELRNTFSYSLLGFDGKETSIKFATSIHTAADRKLGLKPGSVVERMGLAEYYFDPGKKTIYKRQANYGQALDHKMGAEIPVIRHVKSLKFLYFFLDDEGNVEQTKSISRIPVAVQIEVENESGEVRGSAVKLVNIPVGI